MPENRIALDGAWRCGATPEEIVAALAAKQARNEARVWSDWRTADPNKAIEHDRTGEVPHQICATIAGGTFAAELKHVDNYAASVRSCEVCRGTGKVDYESPGPTATVECSACGGTGARN